MKHNVLHDIFIINAFFVDVFKWNFAHVKRIIEQLVLQLAETKL